MSQIASTPAVRRFRRCSLRAFAVMPAFALAIGGLGVGLLVSHVHDVTESYDRVAVASTDEYQDRVLGGTRRGRHWQEARFVRVWLPDGGAGSLRSAGLQGGSTAEVYNAGGSR